MSWATAIVIGIVIGLSNLPMYIAIPMALLFGVVLRVLENQLKR